ncbi:hypothetical protein B0H11DRAFT_1929577 [Mycena galericulata]|nr:hypothetical protein B0H11DRAFT_1929577 [Mycena galericulata]
MEAVGTPRPMSAESADGASERSGYHMTTLAFTFGPLNDSNLILLLTPHTDFARFDDHGLCAEFDLRDCAFARLRDWPNSRNSILANDYERLSQIRNFNQNSVLNKKNKPSYAFPVQEQRECIIIP